MSKKDALVVLIEHSFLLTDTLKQQLLTKLPALTDEQIDALGRFLALEKKQSIDTAPRAIQEIDQLLEQLDKEEKNLGN